MFFLFPLTPPFGDDAGHHVRPTVTLIGFSFK
jgi:hypothetical protein